MPSSNLFHLLAQPPLAVPPAPTVPMSATAPSTAMLMTAHLLDPASPAAGAALAKAGVVSLMPPGVTVVQVFGRWLTRPLAAQTIAAGAWSFGAVFEVDTSAGSSGSITSYTLGGFCVAQWRPGSGVIARAVDAPSAGTTIPGTTDGGYPIVLTQSGASLTLLAGDALCLEVHAALVTGGGASGTVTTTLFYNGLNQYTNVGGGLGAALGFYTDTDAWLLAPALVTFQ
jgi:hypothetical protein